MNLTKDSNNNNTSDSNERVHNSSNSSNNVINFDHPSRTSKTVRQRTRNHRNLRLIMDHLNYRNHDPQEILTCLGFQPEMIETRIPERFLHDSQLKGISFDYKHVLGMFLDVFILINLSFP